MTDLANYARQCQKLWPAPPAVQAAQAQALAEFDRQGLPTRKMEAFRYTNLAPHLENLQLPKAPPHRWQDPLVPGTIQLELTSAGLQVHPQHAELLRQHYHWEENFYPHQEVAQHGAHALMLALLRPGPCLRAKHERPLPLLTLLGKEAPTHCFKLILPAHCQVSWLEMDAEGSGESPWQWQYCDVELGPGAQLQHVKLIGPGSSVYLKGSTVVERDAHYRQLYATFAPRLARQEWRVQLAASGAQSTLLGGYALSGEGQSDHYTHIDHQAPHTSSEQLYKGILQDKSKGVFQGLVHVHPHAQQVQSAQMNKNLLLSPSAQVHTRPTLLIDHDDVKCTHGATVGQLDPEQIFYLQSRGIPRSLAQKQLAQGFMEELFSRLNLAQASGEQFSALLRGQLEQWQAHNQKEAVWP